MASSTRKPMTDVQKAASRQRIATTIGREYQGYKPGGDPRAAAQAVRDAARKALPVIPPAAAPVPLAPPPNLSMPALGGMRGAGGMGGAGGTQAMMRKGGMAGSYRKAADGKAHKGKTEGKMVKMAMGGMTPSTPPKKPVTLQTRQFGTGPGMRPMPKHLGKAVTDRGKAILGKASGGSIGSFRRAADGIASKGKTKGTMVKMAYGGKC